jgi:hypothetical protein
LGETQVAEAFGKKCFLVVSCFSYGREQLLVGSGGCWLQEAETQKRRDEKSG